MTQNEEKLAPKYVKFVAALLSHSTLEGACKELGISRDSGQRYLKHPLVKQAYEDAVRDAFNERLNILRMGVGTALSTLLRNMSPDQPQAVQVRAAAIWLQSAVEIHKMSELEAKFTELEQVISEMMEGSRYGHYRSIA